VGWGPAHADTCPAFGFHCPPLGRPSLAAGIASILLLWTTFCFRAVVGQVKLNSGYYLAFCCSFPGLSFPSFPVFLGMRYVGVQWLGFFMFSNFFSIIFTQYNWCCISKSTMKDVQKSDLKHDFPCFRATSHTRLRARDHYTWNTLIGGKDRVGPSSLNKSRLRDQRSMWMQYGCKVYMDFYMASNGSCFKNHLLEVGLTQNWETWHSECSQPLVYFILFHHVWDPAWIWIHWNSIWLRAR